MGRAINEENTAVDGYLGGIAVIFISAIFICGTFLIFKYCGEYRDYDNWHYGFSIGGTLAVAFQIGFYIVGGLKNAIDAFLGRWKNFFCDLKISFKFAIEGLFTSFIVDGVVLIFYFLILIATIILSVYGFSYLFELYGL